jgi:hypothetical protein
MRAMAFLRGVRRLLDPDWIAHSDAPPMVSDRVWYERLLASIHEDWEATGENPQAVGSALAWVHMHRQLLPAWLSEAAQMALAQQRTRQQTQRYIADAQHRMRWHAVTAVRVHVPGLIWDAVYERAADMLKPTGASGSPETMKKSYAKFQLELHGRPALKSLLGRPEDWDVAHQQPSSKIAPLRR